MFCLNGNPLYGLAGQSDAAKTVTVRIPSGVRGYGTAPVNTRDDNWANAFRGKGWDGAYGSSAVNGNITVQFVSY